MVRGSLPLRAITSQPRQPRRFEARANQTLSGLGPGGPVLYASDPAGPGAKERLVRRLLAGLPGQETDAARRPVVLETTALGQPRLRQGERPGPGVSFSRADGRVWAALTSPGQVGIDVALPSEFEAGYAWARAFRDAELDWARPLAGGNPAVAAALLWTLKEAAVKALGVGFHLLDPLAVEVSNPRPWRGGFRVSVQAGRTLPGWVRPEGGGWLAIARLD
jgi:4'-phosphopantetheinyl transferase superfamily